MLKKTYLLPMAFFILLFSAHNLSAPLLASSSFQEEEKQPQVKPKRSGLIFLPIFFYTPETKWALGAGGMAYFLPLKMGPRTRPSSILLTTMYSQKKQFVFELLPEIYLKGDEYRIKGNIGFSRFPTKFFGVGKATSDDQEEKYTPNSRRFSLELLKRVGSFLNLGIEFQYEWTKIVKTEEDGALTQGDIPGSRGGTTSGLGALMTWDSRNNIFFATSGSFHQFSAALYDSVWGSDFSYNRFNIDLRKYISISASHSLAFQTQAIFKTGNPPFRKMGILGGPNLMRGYYEGRYRDRNMAVLQMEYRIVPLIWKLGVVAFLGFGDVAHKISDFDLANFKRSMGFGLRYSFGKNVGINLRLDFGFGKGSSGIYIAATEAF